MRLSTRLSRMSATSLCIAGMLIFTSMPAFATLRSATGRVLSVRSYASGNVHIFTNIDTLCNGVGTDSVLRVGGPGTERVHDAALEALLRQRTVVIEYDDQREGNFCNLVSLRIT